MICPFYPEPIYFFFSSDVPELLYYSHIPTAIIALIVGLFVFINARKLLLNRLLLIICLSFAGWIYSNLILWTSVEGDVLLFFWTFLSVFAALISVFCIYFVYVFLEKRDIPALMKAVLLLLLTPVLLLAPTSLSLNGLDLVYCDAFRYEGLWFRYYHAGLGLLALVWILILLVRKYKAAEPLFRRQIVLMGLGIEFFLFSFFTMVYLASHLTTIGLVDDSSLEMYGLFGMTVFMVFIGVLIVHFKTFNVGLVASQALVLALIVLVGSQYFFVKSPTSFMLTTITFVLAVGFGYLLVKSVKREIKQREEIAGLATQLQGANERLQELDKMKSEFVSIASHQLRSPLTAIRGYASMLLEGSYGKIPKKAKESIERIQESSRYMALSVEDYLNVSRIEAGNMKYELSNFDLREEVEKVADDVRPTVERKGLALEYESKCSGLCMVQADIGKTRQVIQNLIDNALKYTPGGKISIVTHDDLKRKKVYVTIRDTGVGMSAETIEALFDKFVRAKNANKVNVTGTGLGLFVAKKMVEEMGGRIWAESDGEGKGSSFHIEFPAV